MMQMLQSKLSMINKYRGNVMNVGALQAGRAPAATTARWAC